MLFINTFNIFLKSLINSDHYNNQDVIIPHSWGELCNTLSSALESVSKCKYYFHRKQTERQNFHVVLESTSLKSTQSNLQEDRNLGTPSNTQAQFFPHHYLCKFTTPSPQALECLRAFHGHLDFTFQLYSWKATQNMDLNLNQYLQIFLQYLLNMLKNGSLYENTETRLEWFANNFEQ